MTLYLIRHARPAERFGEENSCLSPQGRAEASELATICTECGARAVISSPLRRAVQTAEILANRLGLQITIEPRLSELTCPPRVSDSRKWLHDFLDSTWTEAAPELRWWRAAVIHTLCGLSTDTLIITHFALINAVVAFATSSGPVLYFRPDYCSVTKLHFDDKQVLHLDSLGKSRDSGQ